MELDWLREYIETAKDLNFSRAADSLYINASTLSRHIVSLERELDIVLIKRTTHGNTLTSEGELACKLFEDIVNQYDSACRILAQHRATLSGTLKAGTLFYLYDLYATALKSSLGSSYPNFNFEITPFMDMNAIIGSLENKQVDLAIVCADVIDESKLKYAPLRREKFMCACASDNALASKDKISINDLLTEKMGVVVTPHFLKNYAFSRVLEDAGCVLDLMDDHWTYPLSPSVVYEKKAVTIVPKHIARKFMGKIRILELDDPRAYTLIGILHTEETEAIISVIEIARNIFGQNV